jgi:hypothetical protein
LGGVRRVGDLLGAMLPPSSGAEQLLPVLRIWPAAVGDVFAREAWPVRTAADGTLVVHVTSSLWASELTLMAGAIRDKLAAALGRPAPPLQFRIGPVPQPASEAPRAPVSALATAAAERLAQQVEDDELREAVKAALERALVRSGDVPDSA